MKSATVKGKSIEPGIKVFGAKTRYDVISETSGAKKSKSYSRIVRGATV